MIKISELSPETNKTKRESSAENSKDELEPVSNESTLAEEASCLEKSADGR